MRQEGVFFLPAHRSDRYRWHEATCLVRWYTSSFTRIGTNKGRFRRPFPLPLRRAGTTSRSIPSGFAGIAVPFRYRTELRVLSCLIHASCWANAPRWGGRLRCWLAAPLPLPQTWTCCAVQIVTRVPLSLYLGPRLVNVVSLRKRPNSLYLQNKLSPYLDALQHLSPLPPVLRQLLPLRHLQLLCVCVQYAHSVCTACQRA